MKTMMAGRMMPAATLLLAALLLIPGRLHCGGPPHGDRRQLPKGCGSCHRGHGSFNTSMLNDRKDTFCFNCHGSPIRVERSRREGVVGMESKGKDIQREFDKLYRHPVEKTGIHNPAEVLPETDPAMPRHVECGDCHHHHLVSADNMLARVSGAGRGRGRLREATFEYEVCFKCHSSSANLPGDQRDKAEEFAVSNPSYHPVIAPGKNTSVPSLIFPLTSTSQIKCTDCHRGDETRDSRGPHGSIYQHILARNFTKTDGEESAFQYALCYGCHRRGSILGNESFPLHKEHIVDAGASCRTCHNSHGSTRNSHLLDLDNFEIRPSASGRLEFIDLGPRAGQCFLECHGKNHDPATYPAALAVPLRQGGAFR